ncbi:MHYT domain-containing protein [Nocardia thailandica]
MLEIHHFTYGWFTPVLAAVMSVLGCFIGLRCAVRHRRSARGGGAWLAGAAIAIGGTGVWVMHFVAMLGFSIQGAVIRYDVPLTALSAVVSVLVVGTGLYLVRGGRPGVEALLAAGTLTGLGVCAMHYLGMYAMNTHAHLSYRLWPVAASVVIAVVASTVALWFTSWVDDLGVTVGAAVVMGVAVNGMHYTGMSAVHAHADYRVPTPPRGSEAFHMLGPVLGISAVVTIMVLVGVCLSELGDTRDSARPPVAEPPRDPAERADA